MTLTPEDLPEIHRSSCDGLVLGLERALRQYRGTDIPTAFEP
jgi:hypothetical protein